MSSKSSTRSQPQQSKIDKSKNRKRFLIKLLVISAVSLILIASIWYWAFGEGVIEKTRMEGYLKDKYAQEFIVENVHESGASLGSKGALAATAYPKSDPALRFDIRRDTINDTIDYENFLQKLWSRQGASEVEAFLAKEFPSNEGYVLKITPGFPVHGETPSLERAMREQASRISYSLSVRNVIEAEGSEPSPAQLNNTMKIVDFVKAKGEMRDVVIYYNYRTTSFNEHDHIGEQKYQYGFQIEQNKLTSISTLDDLKPFFRNLTIR